MQKQTKTSAVSPEDVQLIERCLRHDRAAWSEFVARYSRDIYATVKRVLRRYGLATEQDRVDDAFQLAFDRLYRDDYRRLRQWSGRCSLRSWVCLVSSSAVVDDLRKRRPVPMNQRQEDRFRHAAVETQTSALQLLERADDIRDLRHALEMLNPTDRQLLTSLFLDESSVDALAQELGLSRGAIYTRKNRALGRLKDAVEAIRSRKTQPSRKHLAVRSSTSIETKRDNSGKDGSGARPSRPNRYRER